MRMHGIVYASLKDHVVSVYGRETWEVVRADAGLSQQVYLPIQTYEDAEFGALAGALADRTGNDRRSVLRSVGRSTMAMFMDTYESAVDPSWDALDCVVNAESVVHAGLRDRGVDLDPPKLECERDGDGARIRYRSPRRLCAVATGLAEGIGDHYGTPLSVVEEQCVDDGAPHCELLVTPGTDTGTEGEA